MKILAIETSCDETAIAYIEAKTNNNKTSISILGNTLYSQVKLHEKYGGVFPMMAKREHAKSLTPILEKVLEEAKELKKNKQSIINNRQDKELRKILEREPELFTQLLPFLNKYKKPKVDLIAVTSGPGLEPTLWVGINFAKVLSLIWNIPLVPINHMEGHILASILKSAKSKNASRTRFIINKPIYPMLALLISGGHTELVLAKKIGSYKVIGATRDDAVGEAFDKVARMMDLPYPGGPQISKLAEEARQLGNPVPKLAEIRLPRPMIKSDDFDFSFAGLKTAVLYTIKKLPKLTPEIKNEIALEFENASTEVLISKTRKALLETRAKTLVIGGGVSANTHIRREFQKLIDGEFPQITLSIPDKNLSTDNAIMIAIVAIFKKSKRGAQGIRADGNLSF